MQRLLHRRPVATSATGGLQEVSLNLHDRNSFLTLSLIKMDIKMLGKISKEQC